MTPFRFRRRSLIDTFISMAAIGLPAIFAVVGCGTAGNTYSPLLAKAAADFGITVTPSSVTVAPGSTAQYTVNITSINGGGASVILSASGLPTDATATFGPLIASQTGYTASLAISTTAAQVEAISKTSGTSAKLSRSTPPGSTTFTVIGTGRGITHAATATLVVSQVPDFTISINPASVTLANGNSANYTVTLTSMGGFDVSTVSLAAPTGLPNSTNATYGTPTTTPTGETIPLNIQSSYEGQTPAGNSTFTVSGTGTGITHTVTATLDVGEFTITVTPASPGSDRVLQGMIASYVITVTSVNNFAPPVTLTMPTIRGALVTPGTFTLTPTASGATTTLAIATSYSSTATPVGNYLVNVGGQGGGYTTDGAANLNVFGD